MWKNNALPIYMCVKMIFNKKVSCIACLKTFHIFVYGEKHVRNLKKISLVWPE